MFLRFMVARVRHFQLLLICKSSQLSMYNLLIEMSKNTYFRPEQKIFFQILPYIKRTTISVSVSVSFDEENLAP